MQDLAELLAEISAIFLGEGGNLPQSISGFSGFIISKYLPMAYSIFWNIQLTFYFWQLISEDICYDFCTLVS